MRERQLLMDGTDVDDAAGSAGVAQVPHKSLRDEERALQIDIEHEVVVGLGDIPEIGTPFDAGIVDEDVDRDEFFDRPINDTMIVRGAYDIPGDKEGPPLFRIKQPARKSSETG